MRWVRLNIWKRTRMILGAIAVTILLASIAFGMDCVIVRKQLAAYRESLRHQGQKLTNREIFGSFTAEELARGSNLVVLCRSLTQISDGPPHNWQVNSNGHVFCFSKSPGELLFPRMVSSPIPKTSRPRLVKPATMVENTNGWEHVASQLTSNWGTIEKLATMMEEGQIGFAVHETDFSTNTTEVLQVLNKIETIRDAVLLHLHEGDLTLAHRETMTLLRMLKLMQARRDHIHSISQPLQAAFIGSWECLQYPNWNDSQLCELQSAWEALDFLQSMELRLLSQRNSLGLNIEDCRHHWPFRCMCDLMDDFDEPGRAFMRILDHGEYGLLYGRFPYYWDWILRRSYRDERQGLEGYQSWLGVAANLRSGNLTGPKLSQVCDGYTDPHQTRTREFDLDVWTDKIAITMQLGQAVADQAMKEMMVIAIALKRYQLEHDAYPANLADLSPKYLAKIPLDPAIGQPFKYALDQTNGYRLYSVGLDGTDEGGVGVKNPFSLLSSTFPSRQGTPKGTDWVWPQPATADEVAAELDLHEQRRLAMEEWHRVNAGDGISRKARNRSDAHGNTSR